MTPVADSPSAASPSLAILGGALDSMNLGVAALGYGALKGVYQAFAEPHVVCHAWKRRAQPFDETFEGRKREFGTIMLDPTERLRAWTGIRHVRKLGRLSGLLGPPGRALACKLNPTLSKLLHSDAVLDVSGGDSFADIYGPQRFANMAQFKTLALDLGRPLILLPQTFGPFQYESSKQIVRRIIEQCALAATRERDGLDELADLFDGSVPDHVVVCPDMAFHMDPDGTLADREPLAHKRDDDEVLIGVNVSEFLYEQSAEYGLATSHPELIAAAVDWALSHERTRVLLVPHVVKLPLPPGNQTAFWKRWNQRTDTVACETVFEQLRGRYGDRIACLGGPYTAPQTKYFIGQCDFFMGARMHACIAAISQCVPTMVMAYSKKAAGVMGRIGVGDVVADLRILDLPQCMEQLDTLFNQRAAIRNRLNDVMPNVIDQVRQFFTGDFRCAVERLLK